MPPSFPDMLITVGGGREDGKWQEQVCASKCGNKKAQTSFIIVTLGLLFSSYEHPFLRFCLGILLKQDLEYQK